MVDMDSIAMCTQLCVTSSGMLAGRGMPIKNINKSFPFPAFGTIGMFKVENYHPQKPLIQGPYLRDLHGSRETIDTIGANPILTSRQPQFESKISTRCSHTDGPSR